VLHVAGLLWILFCVRSAYAYAFDCAVHTIGDAEIGYTLGRAGCVVSAVIVLVVVVRLLGESVSSGGSPLLPDQPQPIVDQLPRLLSRTLILREYNEMLW
jgi:hypothetical protein